MSLISEFILTTVKEIRMNRSKPEYRVRTTNIKGNNILVNCLTEYPLFSSKYLNYNDWTKVLGFFNKKEPTSLRPKIN